MSLITPKSPTTSGYSAAITIELHANGVFFPTHTASDYLIFAKPQKIAPGDARLIVTIDGNARESAIEILPHDSPSDRVPIRIKGLT